MKLLQLLILCLVFVTACNSPATETTPTAIPSATTDTSPNTTATDNTPTLSLDAPISKIELGKNGLLTVKAGGKDLMNEKVEDNGLTAFEAHLATMLSISFGRCFNNQAIDDKNQFLLLNSENKLQGLIELPCGFNRKVFRMFGAGKTKEYQLTSGGKTITLPSSELQITAKNLSDFQQIAKGIELQPYNGIGLGEILK